MWGRPYHGQWHQCPLLEHPIRNGEHVMLCGVNHLSRYLSQAFMVTTQVTRYLGYFMICSLTRAGRRNAKCHFYLALCSIFFVVHSTSLCSILTLRAFYLKLHGVDVSIMRLLGPQSVNN